MLSLFLLRGRASDAEASANDRSRDQKWPLTCRFFVRYLHYLMYLFEAVKRDSK